MPPLLSFSRRRRRRGVSELYASMLLIGVTLSLGSFVTATAVGRFSQGERQASIGSSLEGRRAGTLVSLVYVSVEPSPSCPTYGGYAEGRKVEIAIFDYGSESFSPSNLAVNSTVYPGSYTPVQPDGMASYTIDLGACAHPSGQTVLLTDSWGDGFQFES